MEKEKLLDTLHTVLIQELLGRIQGGEAKPADLNVARQLLKDNGIECVPAPDSPFGDLMASLPDLEAIHPLER
jgi:hypothetical protein